MFVLLTNLSMTTVNVIWIADKFSLVGNCILQVDITGINRSLHFKAAIPITKTEESEEEMESQVSEFLKFLKTTVSKLYYRGVHFDRSPTLSWV